MLLVIDDAYPLIDSDSVLYTHKYKCKDKYFVSINLKEPTIQFLLDSNKKADALMDFIQEYKEKIIDFRKYKENKGESK